MGRGGYCVRGWRRGNIYPNVLFAALSEADGEDRLLVIETKGEQRAGNHDTTCRTALLDALTKAFQIGGARHLASPDVPFDFTAAVVLFGDLDARMPALIRKREPAPAA